MRIVVFALLTFAVFNSTSEADPLVFEGTDGPGNGRHIVFLAGDHEYRSEESLPALARLLAKHHGFKCTVLFNINPDTGEIVAGTPSNMPGLEALETADLAVVFLRFQDLPDEQMQHFDRYLKRGGPIVGMRTATHGFKIPAKKKFSRYSFDSKDKEYELGFGHQVLGQTWVGHYGRNHRQSTRITVIDEMKKHPILRGVKDVWVQAGAYVGKPVSGDILTMAQPLDGMTPGFSCIGNSTSDAVGMDTNLSRRIGDRRPRVHFAVWDSRRPDQRWLSSVDRQRNFLGGRT